MTVLQLEQRRKAGGEAETEPEVVGRSLVDPAINAALMQQRFTAHIGVDASLMATIGEVKRITDAVKRGDLSDMEAMLVGQAIALQTISASLAHRAQAQTQQRNLEAFLGLSFKAQAQSRATVQALVELKYPRQVVFAKNVSNINSGQQQINNGVPATPAQAEKTESQQSKLLEAGNGKWMDAGTASTTSGTHPHLATVGQIDRPQKLRRKSPGGA